MRKKIIIFMSLCLALTSVLSGCGGQNSGKDGEKKHIVVTFGKDEITGEVAEAETIFADYLAEHPDVEIEINSLNATDPKMLAMIASGNAPDIIRLNAPSDVATYVMRNMIIPIDEYVEKSDVIKMEDYYDVINLFRFDGKSVGKGDLYGLPKDWSIGSQMWINTALFEENGVRIPTDEDPFTFEEFAEAARKISKKNDDGTMAVIGADLGIGANYNYIEYMLSQQGKSYWKDDFSGTTTLTQQETKDAIKWFFDLQQQGALTSKLNEISSTYAWFAEGKLGMWNQGYWASAYFRDENTDMKIPLENVKLVPGPVFDKNNRKSSIMKATGGVISAQTKHPETAYSVLEYMMTGALAEARAKKGFGFPIEKSKISLLPMANVIDEQAKLATDNDAKYLSYDMKYNPYVNASSIEASFNKYYIPALYGEMTLDEALKAMEEDIEILISEGKEIAGVE